jgi:cytochrome c-type biogenesis protein
MMVSTSSTQLEGLNMLAAYALGLGVPFLLSALLMDSIKLSWQENERMYQLIHRMSAGLLIGLGLLMSTGLFDIVMKGF